MVGVAVGGTWYGGCGSGWYVVWWLRQWVVTCPSSISPRSVCKSMKSWLDSDPRHVAVVHCKVSVGVCTCGTCKVSVECAPVGPVQLHMR